MKAGRLTILSISFLFILSIFAFTQNLSLEWAKQMGGIDSDFSNSMAVDALGNIYITGSFKETVDFDPGPGIFNLSSVGLSDIYVQKLDVSGNLVWAKQMEGSEFAWGKSISVDVFGNVYTIGVFEGTVDFDPGVGTLYLSSNGSYDIFVQKLDASGNLVWANSMGGSTVDWGNSIAIDENGNTYTTGAFYGAVDFDPGSDSLILSPQENWDAFIQKLDTSGNLIWVKQLAGDFYLEGNSLTIDAMGNIYTTGIFSGTADFDPGPEIYNLTAIGLNIIDVFIQKLDASGNFLWAKKVGGPDADRSNSIVVDALNNVYTIGIFRETADFDPGPETYNLSTIGFNDVFIQKLDASGNFEWAKQIGGTDHDNGRSITIDGFGNVYSTGVFTGTVDFNPGEGVLYLSSAGKEDIFIQKLDAFGNLIWAQQMGGTEYETGESIAVDDIGNVYVTGGFNGTTDFDPGIGTLNFNTTGEEDIFVLKLNELSISAHELENNSNIHVYPNPTRDVVNIEFEALKNTDLFIRIYDFTGREVKASKVISTAVGRQVETINVTELAKGLFNIQLTTEGRSESKKIVVQ